LKAIGIFSFQILETFQDYRNLFVFFNNENLKGSLKWLGEPEPLVFTKSENCPTWLETVRRGRPEWNDAKFNQCFSFGGKIFATILSVGNCFLKKWKNHEKKCFQRLFSFIAILGILFENN
jgi:hypothetical protein